MTGVWSDLSSSESACTTVLRGADYRLTNPVSTHVLHKAVWEIGCQDKPIDRFEQCLLGWEYHAISRSRSILYVPARRMIWGVFRDIPTRNGWTRRPSFTGRRLQMPAPSVGLPIHHKTPSEDPGGGPCHGADVATRVPCPRGRGS